jgi:hypothetical protein
VVALRELLIAIRATLATTLRLRWNDLEFPEVRTAILVLLVLLAIALVMLAVRSLSSRTVGRTHLVLPAILPVMRRSYFSATRHLAFLVFLLGVPFFVLALADPYTAYDESSYPGRRVAIVIDASPSMTMKFEAVKLKTSGAPVFYTVVAAGEEFIQRRIHGQYHDIISVIEFGSDAYVITPFTTDYQNVLLSIKLVGDPKEWGRFPDSGTTIIQGIQRATQLFKTFDFVNASGNLMLVFTDGRDDDALRNNALDGLVEAAQKYQIPIYMVRTAFGESFGGIEQDRPWKDAVEKTGGRFYAAADENDVLKAIDEIDKLTPGRVEVRKYRQPRFQGFALIAIALWLLAGALKLGFRQFSVFP